MKKYIFYLSMVGAVFSICYLLSPELAYAGVESSLRNIQDRLIGTILPALAIIGLAIAGISFALGNPNARQHIWYALIGCGVGFGAESLVNFIRTLVR